MPSPTMTAEQKAAAEIERCRAALVTSQYQTTDCSEAVKRDTEALRAAEMRHAPTVRAKLEWHKKMRASYEAKGKHFEAEEHAGWIAECEAALSSLTVKAAA